MISYTQTSSVESSLGVRPLIAFWSARKSKHSSHHGVTYTKISLSPHLSQQVSSDLSLPN